MFCTRGGAEEETAHEQQGGQMALLEGPGYVSRATTCKSSDETVCINVL